MPSNRIVLSLVVALLTTAGVVAPAFSQDTQCQSAAGTWTWYQGLVTGPNNDQFQINEDSQGNLSGTG